MHIPPAPQLIDSVNPLNWISVANYLRRRRPDLLIFKYWLPFFGPCFGTIAKFTKRGTQTRALFICDNIIPHERRPGDVMFTRYAFRQADYFIVQSDSVEHDLNTHFPGSHYRKVPHPVYEIFGAPMDREEARRQLGMGAGRIILFFGYVRAYKGLMTLIDAMKELQQAGEPKDQKQQVRLLVVGEFYEDEAPYRARVKELGLEHSITFVSEYVPNEKVGVYFSAADLVVLPYRSATQSGIAQIAYNFNRPVIATNVGGLAEVILDEKTGFIVTPEDPAALGRAIRRYYEERREAEFTSNILVEKRKYSWENLTSSIEDLTTPPSPATEEGR